jgi:hypothetical protein
MIEMEKGRRKRSDSNSKDIFKAGNRKILANHQVRALLCLLVLASCLFILRYASTSLSIYDNKHVEHFSILIDGGSTGSRVFVFHMPAQEVVVETQVGSCSPGISTLGGAAFSCLQEALQKSKDIIPDDMESMSAMYLLVRTLVHLFYLSLIYFNILSPYVYLLLTLYHSFLFSNAIIFS